MKIKFIVFICFLLVLSFTGCNQDGSVYNSSNPPESITSDSSNIRSEDVRYTDENFPEGTPEEQEIIDLYINPYAVTGLYLSQFSQDNMSGLDGNTLMNMFEALGFNLGYPEAYPTSEELNKSQGQVPASVVEELLAAHFDLSPEEVREKCASNYNAENNTYFTPGGLGGGPARFIITDHKQDENTLVFSYEYYGPAETQEGEEFYYSLFQTGTATIEGDGESFVFLSNTSKDM